MIKTGLLVGLIFASVTNSQAEPRPGYYGPGGPAGGPGAAAGGGPGYNGPVGGPGYNGRPGRPGMGGPGVNLGVGVGGPRGEIGIPAPQAILADIQARSNWRRDLLLAVEQGAPAILQEIGNAIQSNSPTAPLMEELFVAPTQAQQGGSRNQPSAQGTLSLARWAIAFDQEVSALAQMLNGRTNPKLLAEQYSKVVYCHQRATAVNYVVRYLAIQNGINGLPQVRIPVWDRRASAGIPNDLHVTANALFHQMIALRTSAQFCQMAQLQPIAPLAKGIPQGIWESEVANVYHADVLEGLFQGPAAMEAELVRRDQAAQDYSFFLQPLLGAVAGGGANAGRPNPVNAGGGVLDDGVEDLGLVGRPSRVPAPVRGRPVVGSTVNDEGFDDLESVRGKTQAGTAAGNPRLADPDYTGQNERLQKGAPTPPPTTAGRAVDPRATAPRSGGDVPTPPGPRGRNAVTPPVEDTFGDDVLPEPAPAGKPRAAAPAPALDPNAEIQALSKLLNSPEVRRNPQKRAQILKRLEQLLPGDAVPPGPTSPTSMRRRAPAPNQQTLDRLRQVINQNRP